MEELANIDKIKADGRGGLSLYQLESLMSDIRYQPLWRDEADTCGDFYDGHQLTTERLARMTRLGIPPLITNLIAPVINSVLGQEAKARTDWRVTEADEADQVPEEMMLALNAKLNEIERESRADRAISDAYASMIKTGVGWVEVSRATDCFAYPYRVESVHRNEIWWDWRSSQPDLSDARYLVRKRRFDVDELVALMPEKKTLIEAAVFDNFKTWQFEIGSQSIHDSDLAYAAHLERVTNIDTIEWRDSDRKRATLFEVWYRQWVRGKVLELPNGTVVKFDAKDPQHAIAVSQGYVTPQVKTYSDIRVAFFLGCHRLYDMPTPYPHRFFPYVPFFGYKEDSSGVRYGMIRSMISPQDVVNSADAKMHWLLNSRRIIATSDAIDLSFNSWRQVQDQISSPAGVVLLDPTKPQAKFTVESEFTLSAQQFSRRMQAAADIENAGGIYKAALGKESAAASGIAINSLIEQTGVMMAEINDNASFARRQVGEILFSLQLEDMGQKETRVAIKKHGKKSIVTLNQRVHDQIGTEAIENDVSTVKAKVTLTDIPTTPSFKAQQLAILSEVAKSLPAEMQAVFVPAMILLSDAPDKEDLAEEIRKMAGLGPKLDDEEQAAADAKSAEASAAAAALEQRTNEANVKLLEAKVDQLVKQSDKTVAETVAEMVKAIYASMQAGQVVATVPHVAPIADELLRSAGFPDAHSPDISPELQAQAMPDGSTTEQPLPASPFVGEQTGIETMRNDGVQQPFGNPEASLDLGAQDQNSPTGAIVGPA
jgi:hypothetical protein